MGVMRARKESEDTAERVWILNGIPRLTANEGILEWAEEAGLLRPQLVETSMKGNEDV
jgi:hypothetical protein